MGDNCCMLLICMGAVKTVHPHCNVPAETEGGNRPGGGGGETRENRDSEWAERGGEEKGEGRRDRDSRGGFWGMVEKRVQCPELRLLRDRSIHHSPALVSMSLHFTSLDHDS